jgi:hypothetical protein
MMDCNIENRVGTHARLLSARLLARAKTFHAAVDKTKGD